MAPAWVKEDEAMAGISGEAEAGAGRAGKGLGRVFEEGDAVFKGVEPGVEPG